MSRAARRPRKPNDYALYRGADRAAREAEGHGALVKARVRLDAEHRAAAGELLRRRHVAPRRLAAQSRMQSANETERCQNKHRAGARQTRPN